MKQTNQHKLNLHFESNNKYRNGDGWLYDLEWFCTLYTNQRFHPGYIYWD